MKPMPKVAFPESTPPPRQNATWYLLAREKKYEERWKGVIVVAVSSKGTLTLIQMAFMTPCAEWPKIYRVLAVPSL